LRHTVFLETAVGVIVLALTAVLVAEPRGTEALQAQDQQPVTASAPLTRSADVTVTVDPGTHGEVDLTVSLPVAANRVTATATQQHAQIGPLPVALKSEGHHTYSGSANLPVAGNWHIDLNVTRSKLATISTDTVVHLH
jgi:copper transport protein